MRPRHKAAENATSDPTEVVSASAASMRPRHKAAENGDSGEGRSLALLASMRPRHKAAENFSSIYSMASARSGFNEAAA